MKKNMGVADRIFRMIGAAIIVILYLTDDISGTIAAILLFVAAVFAATSIFSVCPFYRLIGINSFRE